MTVQGVQNCGLPFSIYALWGAPIFSLRALKIFCDFLYDCIFIMIWLKKRFPSHFRLRYFVLFPAFVLRHFLSHACAAASRISFSGAFSPGKYRWTKPIFLACNGLAPLHCKLHISHSCLFPCCRFYEKYCQCFVVTKGLKCGYNRSKRLNFEKKSRGFINCLVQPPTLMILFSLVLWYFLLAIFYSKPNFLIL